jgi:hypothetical protein
MREILYKFFKNKFNIALCIIQAISLICLTFSSISVILNILFLFFESLFFILWGISQLLLVSKIKSRKNEYSLLPYNKDQLEMLSKRDKIEVKNIKFKGVMLIILGVFLVITTFLAII